MMPAMVMQRWVVAVAVSVATLPAACGGSGMQTYRPTEIDVSDRSEMFARARAATSERGLALLEEDEERGIVSSQWEKVGARHYNIQVLISPVSAVVRVGCRIQRNLEIAPCEAISSFPNKLVKDAKALTEALR